MRSVLIITPWFPRRDAPSNGIFVLRQAEALRTLGWQVAVLTWQTHYERRPDIGLSVREDSDLGFPTFRAEVRVPHVPGLAHLLVTRAATAVAKSLSRRGQPTDIVHAHVYMAGLPALTLGRRLNAKVVLSEHFSRVARGHLSRRERAVARRAYEGVDLVAPVSSCLTEAICSIAKPRKVTVIGNPVDPLFFSPMRRRGALPSQLRLLFVGNLVPVKGLRHLLHALHLLDGAIPVHLRVVGDGSERADLEGLARELNLSSVVTFLGERSPVEVREFLTQTDALVAPSEWENLPGAILEAFAMGVPVVATRVGGVPALVSPSRGILAATPQPEHLAEAITQFPSRADTFDPDRLSEYVASHFSREAIGQSWTKAYDALLGPSPLPGPPLRTACITRR